MPAPLDDIERVNCAKLLGVVINGNCKFAEHVKTILSQCSQRLYLIKLLRDQGLCQANLNIIFEAIVVSKITYALPAWGGFVTAALIDQINAFFRRANRYKLCSKIYNFEELFIKTDKIHFRKIQDPHHCINFCLPSQKISVHDLRKKGHNFILPMLNSELCEKNPL